MEKLPTEQGLLSSRALAMATEESDPTIEDILCDIGAEEEFRALTALFMGEARALNLETQADPKVFEDRQERRARGFLRSGNPFQR